MSETSTSEIQSQPINALTPFVTIIDNRPVTTSRAVAEYFKKRHKDVLEAIRNLEIPDEFNGRNFRLVEYADAKGEKRPMYEMTESGFTLVAMGFTGSEAMRFKVAYIERFNAMRDMINSDRAAAALPEGFRAIETDHLIELYEDHITLQNEMIQRLKAETGARQKVTAEEVQRIMEMDAAGYPPSVIARTIDRKVETVGTVLRRERQRQASLKKEAHQ